MKKFISQSFRRGILITISIVLILAINGIEIVKKIQSIEKIQITASVDENLREGFEEVLDFTNTDMYYDISYSKDTKNSQIVLTSEIENINQSKDYKVLAYSPLVFVMKQSKNLNDLLITNNEKGFLISESKIKNQNSDKINCDFTKIVEAIIENGKWSYLGGSETEEIKVFCPKLDTVQGKLFKEFLIRSYNKGLNESNEEIESKIQKFFDSDNVIQTDVISKMEMLKDNISEYEIFINFEHEFLKYHQSQNSFKDLSVIYPQKTILKYIYIQCNTQDEQFKEKFFKKDSFWDEDDIEHKFYEDYFYRYGQTGPLDSLNYSCNVQAGIDAFEIE